MRIGLVGWAARTGTGLMGRDLWDAGLITKWLAPKHPILGWEECICPPEADRCYRENDGPSYRRFLSQIDVLLFVEHPHVVGYDLVQEARSMGKLVVCIPMIEWLPRAAWVLHVDLMWAVTEWTRGELLKVVDEIHLAGKTCRWELGGIVGGRWGVDVDRFEFSQRDQCRRFLFVNGNGGALQRKGVHVMVEAAARAPGCVVFLRTQKKELPRLPANVRVLMENAPQRWRIYDKGDVLITPSRWEGLGLQLYEAQACGMPVLATDGEPMAECRPLERLPVREQSWVQLCGRKITTHEVDPAKLAEIMQRWQDRDIRAESHAARQFILEHHRLADVVADLRAAIEARLATLA